MVLENLLHIQNKFNKKEITPVILDYFKELKNLNHLSLNKETLQASALKNVSTKYLIENNLRHRKNHKSHEYIKAKNLLK